MISKKLIITLFFSLPIFWLLFYVTPKYLLPAQCFLDNYIYIDNLILHHFYHYDKFSTFTFDDSANILFNTIVSFVSTTLKINTNNAIILVNCIAHVFSFYTMVGIVKSRFSNVNFFIMLSLLLGVQIWAALLGSDVLFIGFLYLLVIRAFWNKRYTFLLIASSVLIAINILNFFYVLPLIISSYVDVNELKQREKKRFYLFRITKTVIYLIIPVIIFYSYRLIYFGKVLPYQFNAESLSKILIFDKSALYFGLHYLRYFILPILIGVLFYFIKQRKKITSKHYAIFIGYVLIPIFVNALHPQIENVAYKNYYIIYLGLIVLTFIFIRDFRSLSQKISFGIFILFYALPQMKNYTISSLQQYHNNLYRVANNIKFLNYGKIIAYDDNFLSYTSNWQTIFANNRHTPRKQRINYTESKLLELNADIVLYHDTNINSIWYDSYEIFLLPENIRQYIKEQKPENAVDYLFYFWREKYDKSNFKYIPILVKKKSMHYKSIKEILIKHGAKQKD